MAGVAGRALGSLFVLAGGDPAGEGEARQRASGRSAATVRGN